MELQKDPTSKDHLTLEYYGPLTNFFVAGVFASSWSRDFWKSRIHATFQVQIFNLDSETKAIFKGNFSLEYS
ncbi:MAG: hypothetical protein ABSB32_07775 [Thermodesulfobacteriota bacterium]|jgi:hypothetical protein